MKKTILIGAIILCQSSAHAANLLEVYQQAQTSDPTFLQAVSQRLATKEGVPISAAAILPNINLTANPSATRFGYSGTNYQTVVGSSSDYIFPRNLTQRGYTMNLSLTQTIFNFSQFSTIAQQVSLSKGADATLNAELQKLMTRVAAAYFAILRDEDNLSYAEASKLAFAEQLDQIKQQYRVGLKTVTDVYTAQASYDSALATHIGAQNTLDSDRENLRVITGVYYPQLTALSEDFPLVSPEPHNMEAWVQHAYLYNWTIKAAEFNAAAAKQVIHEQEAGHLPTVNVQTSMTRQYTDNINNYQSFSDRNGPGTTSDRAIALNVNVPIFAGGGVIASTRQATYNYQVAQQQLELAARTTVNITRQSYLSLIAGISKINADKQAVKSSISSLEGLEASYRVGTETLVDVLNQQQKVFQAQTQYAADRYEFVNNLLTLKQSAGTLSFDDLRAINAWLMDKEQHVMSRSQAKAMGHKKARRFAGSRGQAAGRRHDG